MTVDSTGLEYWRDAASGPAVDRQAIARMVDDPRLDGALRRSFQDSLAFFGANTGFNVYFLDHGTFFLGNLAIYLHVSGGLTHRRLALLCGTSKLLSAGRASAILLNLRSKGFLTRGERRGDDRTVLYTPTPRMMDAYRERLKIDLEASAVVEPAIAPLMARWEEPGVYETYMRLVGDHLVRAAATPSPDVDIINKLNAFRASMLILYVLMDSADDGGAYPPGGTATYAVSALAARFRVSRSHVRRVLSLWEEAGFIARGASEGTATLLPPLHGTLKRYFAIAFIAGLRFAHETLIALRDSAPSDVGANRLPNAAAGATAERQA